MIRKPEELTESIRQAVDHRAVLFSNIMLAVVVAVHTALDPHALGYQVVLAIILSTTLTILLLLRVFDLGTVNKRPLVYVIFYQIFCFIGLAFISDAATPYTIGLYLVVFVSNLYYGAKGVWVTVACFGVTTVVKYFYLVNTAHIDISSQLNVFVAFFVFTAVCSVYVNYQKVFDWDRARLKESDAKLVGSINSLEFGFIITDSTPQVSMINETAHRVFCGSHDHATAKCPHITVSLLSDIFGVRLDHTIAKSIAEHKPHTINDIEYKHSNWRIFVTPIQQTDTASGATIIIQDVTEEFVLNRSRDEFFSIASHELRTPLTAIRGNASMMLEYYKDDLKKPDLKEMVSDIHASSERLIDIINDFLDVSSIESNKIVYKLNSVAIKPTIEKVMKDLHAVATEKKLKIKLGDGLAGEKPVPNIVADADRLVQVLYNMIGNAMKFTAHGTITIDVQESHNHTIKITIADSGIGIDPKNQPLLFRKFQQAGHSLLARDGEGTGLGLYVSRLLVEGMHGTIGLDSSTPGKGSVFSFSLPIATAERVKHNVIPADPAAVATLPTAA